jgi:hypothetical protein
VLSGGALDVRMLVDRHIVEIFFMSGAAGHPIPTLYQTSTRRARQCTSFQTWTPQ